MQQKILFKLKAITVKTIKTLTHKIAKVNIILHKGRINL